MVYIPSCRLSQGAKDICWIFDNDDDDGANHNNDDNHTEHDGNNHNDEYVMRMRMMVVMMVRAHYDGKGVCDELLALKNLIYDFCLSHVWC